jgi:Na+-transporting methylmalonyl-CoA/oxaloacetate decarboxylase gamma subunit
MHSSATTMPLALASEGTIGRAVEIAALGMLMVFLALGLLTLFLNLLPYLLGRINAVWPESADRHALPDGVDQTLDEEDEVLAAIGFVLHAEGRERP